MLELQILNEGLWAGRRLKDFGLNRVLRNFRRGLLRGQDCLGEIGGAIGGNDDPQCGECEFQWECWRWLSVENNKFGLKYFEKDKYS